MDFQSLPRQSHKPTGYGRRQNHTPLNPVIMEAGSIADNAGTLTSDTWSMSPNGYNAAKWDSMTLPRSYQFTNTSLPMDFLPENSAKVSSNRYICELGNLANPPATAVGDGYPFNRQPFSHDYTANWNGKCATTTSPNPAAIVTRLEQPLPDPSRITATQESCRTGEDTATVCLEMKELYVKTHDM